VHYCQTCTEPVRLEPEGDDAVCSRCGYREPAPRAPLFLVTGASAAGKTVIGPRLAARLAGRCLTVDADLLMDAAGEMAGGAPIVWSGFWAGWLAVAHGAAASGLPTVVLGPLRPDGFDEQPARRWVGPIHVLLLDCPDDERRRRIERRPSWRHDDTDAQVEFGRWLRAQVPDQIDTSTMDPHAAVAAVATWVEAILDEG
jgi:hypothetical protein